MLERLGFYWIIDAGWSIVGVLGVGGVCKVEKGVVRSWVSFDIEVLGAGERLVAKNWFTSSPSHLVDRRSECGCWRATTWGVELIRHVAELMDERTIRIVEKSRDKELKWRSCGQPKYKKALRTGR
ncbi:hypothetical protein Drorol1_Dr00011919 [Drosera rotundifolia]